MRDAKVQSTWSVFTFPQFLSWSNLFMLLAHWAQWTLDCSLGSVHLPRTRRGLVSKNGAVLVRASAAASLESVGRCSPQEVATS